MAETPNPGSDAAVDAGCTCPVLDNGHGRGATIACDGAPLFWITHGCPLHAGPVTACSFAPAPEPRP